MRIAGAHLTYCTNIHPGESWDEIRGNLERHVPAVKRAVSPDRPFGLGLRLSCVAARELAEPGRRAAFAEFLRRESLYVCTVNGFPYGPFHGTRVKESVYLPDWRDPARLDYTNLLADLLADWLPAGAGETGSISTVPGAFRTALGGADDVQRMAEHVVDHAAHLVELERRTGRHLVLALEPEPCCFLETVAETVRFFREHLHAPAAVARLASRTGLDAPDAAAALRRHLGVCLDLCHAAVEYEDPTACVEALAAAGVAIAKVQVTAGLRVPRMTDDSAAALRGLEDTVYLHQVVERGPDGLRRYPDLGAALSAAAWRDQPCEWRVHFHVPVFREALGTFASTQPFVRAVLARHRLRPLAPHLEVETYTWSVLPAEHRDIPVETAIARELHWVLGELR